MIDKEMLEILVCPENRSPLRLAGEDLLAKLNEAIAAGHITNRAGQPLAEPISSALVRQDDAVLYPIVDDIPVLLIDEAVSLEQLR